MEKRNGMRSVSCLVAALTLHRPHLFRPERNAPIRSFVDLKSNSCADDNLTTDFNDLRLVPLMKRFLIDIPTLTSVWVTARSEDEAIAAVNIATADCDLHIQIGDDYSPIELINFTCRGEHEIIGEEDEDEEQL